MFRSAAWLLTLLLPILPLTASTDDRLQESGPVTHGSSAQEVQDYISTLTGVFDENPHSCYEADEGREERPDLANRPQS
ncbi:MAG: hypothetical protein COW30_10335 [Rhodospirillales bacterium CG15_BIG_FIL_POST_REV_8_21_14_020_66_15]|nr:MAG: hypothetical protein COW30_10335 [Rhodospirillales bacterium CG15_BIG_FIL_POST_REV_8_21_14_020_66_15]